MSVAAVTLWWAASAHAAGLEWPLEINAPKAKIVIYQPQLESFTGDKLTARAAVSVTKAGTPDPVFGAVWLAARVSTDRDRRVVKCLEVNVTDAKFPNADPGEVEKLSQTVRSDLSGRQFVLSLDRLLTMLDLVEKEENSAEGLKTTPPKIVFVDYPAVLVAIDGEPKLTKIKDSKLMRVVNTPFLIVYEPSEKTYYLNGNRKWLAAPDVMGPWQGTENAPAEAVALVSDQTKSGDRYRDRRLYDDLMPRIIVATEPTELIQTEGTPTFGTIRGTNILYVSNTESDVFMDIDTQEIHVLLSGRWFTARSKDGPWQYVASDQLPSDFAKIPPGS